MFRPSLKHWPVVVLSNNDGCCIARGNEARALNIKMLSPACLGATGYFVRAQENAACRLCIGGRALIAQQVYFFFQTPEFPNSGGT